MWYCGRVALVAVFTVLASAQLAQAQKRVALVIGNSDYQHTGKLANPKNDAMDMAAALKKFGFAVVEGLDLDKAAFDRKVHDFARALAGADAGLLFYAGHGLQVAGRNYLVPIDAKAELEALLHLEMVRAEDIQRVMEASSKTNVLFLDACRDNPLARNLARSMGTRSSAVGTGLASIESGVGTLISFSTHPGAVASDGTGRNSPYTGALVKYVAAADDDLNTILINVRKDVRRDTQGKQVPWEHSSLEGRFYFAAPSAPAVTAPTPPYSAAADAARVCREVEGMSSLSLLGVLTNQHKGTPAGDCIAARIEELKKVAVATPPPQPTPAPSVKPAVQVTPAPAPIPTPGRVFRDCPDCPEMVVVPAGSFMMGAPEGEAHSNKGERPQHTVTIGKPFAVGKYEVTFNQFAYFIKATGRGVGDTCAVHQRGEPHPVQKKGSFRNPGYKQTGQHPAVCVSWDDAKAYAAWLSKTANRPYRLLSEAEWEYAARAGTTNPSYFDVNRGCQYENGADRTFDRDVFQKIFGYAPDPTMSNICNDGFGFTSPVGQFAPNSFGTYDMLGNVQEWVEDCLHSNYSGAPSDGSAWVTEACERFENRPYRVTKGQHWGILHFGLRAAERRGAVSEYRDYKIGFRVARTLSP